MSLAKKSFSAAMAAPFVLAFGLAANSAQAEVQFGCRKPGAEVAALQKQVLEEEGMIPVGARPTARSETEYAQETIMLNLNTGKGVLWEKIKDGSVCINRQYENGRLLGNKAFDTEAFIQIPGKNPRDIPANLRLAALSTGEFKQNPMFRADTYVPTNAAKNDPVRYPVKYIEYMAGHPETQAGTIMAASFDGRVLKDFTKDIPAKGTTSFAFGATYTPAGAEYLKTRVASASPLNGQYALNKN